MRNMHNQNVAELVHYIIVFYTQVQGPALVIQELQFSIYFFQDFEVITSPLNLESSWQPRYSTVSCFLVEWPAKDIPIFLKPLISEKRMDLVLSSPKGIDISFSMNHWHSDENSLFKTFSIFLMPSCWQKIHISSAYKQEPASDNDWGRSFRYNRKKISPRVEPCGRYITQYFNVPVSEKTSIQTKIFLFERQDSNHLITDVPNQSISFFQGEPHGQSIKYFLKIYYHTSMHLFIHSS